MEQTDLIIESNWESFEDMNLKDQLLRGIYSYGFERPSVLQQKVIKSIILNLDTIAQAQSGTGKTATFTIGLLQNIDTSLTNFRR
jgi:superfamily II DNA/RNA helicase